MNTTSSSALKNIASDFELKSAKVDSELFSAAISMEMHFGKTLKILAGNYNSIMKVGYELIQNALDANATKIWLVIDLKTSEITCSDNGDGMTPDFFNSILQSISSSWKSDASDMLGKFGIGLWAAVDKCKSFSVTTTSSDKPRGYHRWLFDANAILSSSRTPQIPYGKCTGMQYGERPSHKHDTSTVPWRTQYHFQGITQDRIVSRLDINDFVDEVQSVFGLKMHSETEVNVRVVYPDGKNEAAVIRAKVYAGTRIPEYNTTIRIDSNRALSARFEMYLSQSLKGKYQGKIHIRDRSKPFRVKMSSLLKSGVSEWLSAEVVEVLKSGVFEGDIIPSCIDLKEDRNVFVYNEDWHAFCLALEKWYSDVAKVIYQDIVNVHKDRKRDTESRRAVAKILNALNLERNSHLKKMIEARLHSYPPVHDPESLIPVATAPIISGDKKANDPVCPLPSVDKERRPVEKVQPDDSGKERTPRSAREKQTCLGDLGVGIDFVADPVRKDELFWIDFTRSAIVINCCNPDYMKAEQRDDDSLTGLLGYVLSNAILLMSCDQEVREVLHIILANDLASLYLPFLIP